eukprot:COSAG02_NODE_47290_length_342_cov_0.847737_1_plen_71_part_01
MSLENVACLVVRLADVATRSAIFKARKNATFNAKRLLPRIHYGTRINASQSLADSTTAAMPVLGRVVALAH